MKFPSTKSSFNRTKVFTMLLASIFVASSGMAGQVPPTDHAQVPAQADKGISTANEAQVNQGQSQDHKPQSVLEQFYGSPLSSPTAENEKDSVVPPSDHAQLPSQSDKGIATANDAKANQGQSADHKPSSDLTSNASSDKSKKDAEVPPSDHAQLPPQSEKGVTTANDAKANHGQSGDHKPSDLNVSSNQNSQGNEGKGIDKNKGKNAVEVLDRVATKLEARNSSHSKAAASVRRAQQRISDRIS